MDIKTHKTAWHAVDGNLPRASACHPRHLSYGRLAVFAAFAAIYLIWGSSFLAIRYAVATIPPFLMAGVRFTVAGLIMYAFLRWRGLATPSLRQWRAGAIAGGLLFLGGGGLLAWGEQTVPSGIAALLVATTPLWVVLIDTTGSRGVRLDLAVLVGIVLGVAGVAVLMISDTSCSSQFANLTGTIAILLGTLSWSVGVIYTRRSSLTEDPVLAAMTEQVGGGLLLILVGLLIGEWDCLDIAAISVQSALSVAYLVLFGSVIAFTAFRWLLTVTSPAKVSTHAFVNPLVAVILGWALAGELLTGETLLAAAMIVLGVALITQRTAPVNRDVMTTGRRTRQPGGARLSIDCRVGVSSVALGTRGASGHEAASHVRVPHPRTAK